MALEYFKLGNAITAFYVVQTFIFLHAIYKETRLLNGVCAKREIAVKATLIIATIYLLLILGCAILEFVLTHQLPSNPHGYSGRLKTSIFVATGGRGLIVISLAYGCVDLIRNQLKPEESSSPEKDSNSDAV